jgi:hypothetical protein
MPRYPTPPPRTSISRVQLAQLFEERFTAQGARACGCVVPPVLYSERSGGRPNWRLGFCSGCARGCDADLRRIEEDLAALYEIRAP